MKIVTAPMTFSNILDPRDLNAAYLYAKDALRDVVSRRFQRSTLVLPFVESMAVPYDEAMNAEQLTYRFKCPNTCILERAILSAHMTSSAEVRWRLLSSGGSPISGVSDPLLTNGGAVTSEDVNQTSLDRVVLTAGTEYQFRVETTSPATFDLFRADLTLHLLTDRWVSNGILFPPTFDPTLFTDASARNATVVAANNTAISNASSTMTKYAPAPVLVLMHNLTSGTDVDLRTFPLPRFDSGRAQCRIVRVYVWAYLDSADTLTVTASLYNAAGALQASAAAPVSAAQQGSGDSGVISIDFAVATPNVSTDNSADWSIVFSSNGATNARKVYALVWMTR